MSEPPAMTSVLVTGIAGGLARRVAERLVAAGCKVTGVDYRIAPSPIAGVDVHRASYNKTAIEDVFRRTAFDAVFHLGRVGDLSEEIGKRFDLNVTGSQKLMNLCVAHGVKSLVVLSTFHIYGAHPRNPTPISEDEPLRAGAEFPQIADAIQLDNMASTWIYRHREVRTVVLRPTNVVGPTLENTISKFLRLPRIPYMAGFDPMVQFVHEDDMADAIVAASSGDARGVFNVAGPAVLPWKTALEIVGAKTLPLPSSATRIAVRIFSALPAYLVNFYKYPCVISDARLRRTFGWEPKIDIVQTLRSAARRRSA
jgi:UDP-glucose 4-epimerase